MHQVSTTAKIDTTLGELKAPALPATGSELFAWAATALLLAGCRKDMTEITAVPSMQEALSASRIVEAGTRQKLELSKPVVVNEIGESVDFDRHYEDTVAEIARQVIAASDYKILEDSHFKIKIAGMQLEFPPETEAEILSRLSILPTPDQEHPTRRLVVSIEGYTPLEMPANIATQLYNHIQGLKNAQLQAFYQSVFIDGDLSKLTQVSSRVNISAGRVVVNIPALGARFCIDRKEYPPVTDQITIKYAYNDLGDPSNNQAQQPSQKTLQAIFQHLGEQSGPQNTPARLLSNEPAYNADLGSLLLNLLNNQSLVASLYQGEAVMFSTGTGGSYILSPIEEYRLRPGNQNENENDKMVRVMYLPDGKTATHALTYCLNNNAVYDLVVEKQAQALRNHATAAAALLSQINNKEGFINVFLANVQDLQTDKSPEQSSYYTVPCGFGYKLLLQVTRHINLHNAGDILELSASCIHRDPWGKETVFKFSPADSSAIYIALAPHLNK